MTDPLFWFVVAVCVLGTAGVLVTTIRPARSIPAHTHRDEAAQLRRIAGELSEISARLADTERRSA